MSSSERTQDVRSTGCQRPTPTNCRSAFGGSTRTLRSKQRAGDGACEVATRGSMGMATDVGGRRFVPRDHTGVEGHVDEWWGAKYLPQVRYDAQALIIDANEAAEAFFGRRMVGHHWQEFVTPGSTDQVGVMLEILAEVGAAEPRFRMPRPDGGLIEFDSFTFVDGEELVTLMRGVEELRT